MINGAYAYVFVVVSAVLAATGQLFFKLGATGAAAITDFLNLRVTIGLVLYALSTMLWIGALSKLPLTRVYPFTILTFVTVYVASFVILGERVSVTVLIGATLVIVMY
jgi:drug/metabolite transporter (DMT)-like permease